MSFSSFPNFPVFQELIINKIIERNEIKQEDKIRYLGVIIDCHLRWNYHIDEVTKCLRLMMYKFNGMNKILQTQYLKILYNALVESRLQYGFFG